jgi:uncharacterized protein YjaZ
VSLNLHILKATGRLNPYVKDIENVYLETEKKITNVLPVKNVDIVIMDNPEYTIPEIGIGGHTYSPSHIVVSLDPTFSNFQIALQTELLDTLVHELHHAARWATVGYGKTLLEAMVSEGLADHFAIEITKRKDIHPWDNALSEEQSKLLEEKAIKEYNNKDYNHDAWFFGSKEKEIPRWTAYTLGFQLVGDYLKNHPGSKASTLCNLPAEKFVK